MPNPRLTLVGAGPGDPEMITLKGVKALQSADVVLYDALVARELLDHASKAKKVFVGKRRGFRAYSQDEINELIVSEALSHGHVVRLKGGDPFVFGRGGEEVEYAGSFGIDAEIVPGISSSMAVPARSGISVTQRSVSQSVWILTGTTSERQLSEDMAHAARTSATLVVLMGMSKLAEIVKIFHTLGKFDTPIAIIQNGTLPSEKKAVGTMTDILDLVIRQDIANPAVIVIGEVVRHAYQLRSVFEEYGTLRSA